MKNLRASIVSTLLLALAVGTAACDEGTNTPDPVPGPGTGQPNVPGNGQPGEPGPVEPSCPTTTTGPTVHKGEIAADETWTAETGPHVIDSTIVIRSGRTLTIAPCVEVQIAKGAAIQVAFPGTPNTGSFVAEGTAKRPIKMIGKEGARWSSLYVHAPGTARLAHVTLEGGGGGDFQNGATVTVLGDGVDGADPLLFVDHVTIARSLGTGAWLQRGATFIEGSRDLTIKESGGDPAAQLSPYPIEIEEHAIDRLPSGSYTGNRKDEILIDPRGGQTSGSGIMEDSVLHDRGVPYHVGRSRGSSLTIGGRPDKRLVTLTIEPGVDLRFEPGGALKVQHFVTTQPSTAAIKAVGTADKPIVLRSASATPQPGDWQGVWFGGIPNAADVMEHVRISHAGGDCGCILNTCSNITSHEGAVIFTAQPPSAFIRNSEFVAVAGHGITQGYDGAFVDFRPTNQFGVTGCAQTRPRESTTTCPAPRPACD